MKRNYGIDFLRMVLMLMVVVLHILGHGGVIRATGDMTLKYGTAWLLESFAYCAVNSYALISGYVYISSKYRVSSFVQIWLQALVYSLGIAVCMWILKPESFSPERLIFFLFPVSNHGYWYLSAYAGLFVLIPFLNAAIHAIPKETIKIYMGALFFVFTVLTTVFGHDPFSFDDGYGTFWLAYMYAVGACMRKYGWWDTLRTRKALLIYLGSVLVSWGVKMGSERIAMWLQKEPPTAFNLISYTSPTMVLAAVALFLMFKNIVVAPVAARFIAEFSPAAFGVYLIHEHDSISRYFVIDKFGFLAEYSTPVMVMAVLVLAAAVFAVCLLIDWVRVKVFRRLRVKERLETLESKIAGRIGKKSI